MEQESSEDTYSYRGWLVSDSFFKRAFAILGHNLVAALMIQVTLFAVILVFVLLFGGLSLLF
jgi:hypothetical protein